jgi:hypothetical protein
LSCERCLRVGVLGIGACDGRIDQGHNTTEEWVDGEGGVRADRGDADCEGIEVLFCCDKASCGSDDIRTSSQFGENGVTLLELVILLVFYSILAMFNYAPCRMGWQQQATS